MNMKPEFSLDGAFVRFMEVVPCIGHEDEGFCYRPPQAITASRPTTEKERAYFARYAKPTVEKWLPLAEEDDFERSCIDMAGIIIDKGRVFICSWGDQVTRPDEPRTRDIGCQYCGTGTYYRTYWVVDINNMVACHCCTQPCSQEHDCEKCDYNVGIYNSSGHIAGQCGQQNCWFGVIVCRHNGYSGFVKKELESEA